MVLKCTLCICLFVCTKFNIFHLICIIKEMKILELNFRWTNILILSQTNFFLFSTRTEIQMSSISIIYGFKYGQSDTRAERWSTLSVIRIEISKYKSVCKIASHSISDRVCWVKNASLQFCFILHKINGHAFCTGTRVICCATKVS